MSQQTTLFPNVQERRPTRYLTHYYSKKDVMRIWGIADHAQFVSMIGEAGKAILGWREGKQKFTPNQVRELIALVGPPLTKEEIGR